MRKLSLLLISVLVLAVEQTPAQTFIPTPVEISKDKVRTGGELFYVHKVLQGQTLFSIAKAYGLSLDELKSYNVAVSQGLKAGTLLYIPVNPKTAPAAEPVTGESSAAAPVETEPDDIRAASSVAAGTVSETSAAAAVPVVQNAVRSGDTPEAGTVRTIPVPDRKFKKHTARWYETLNDVADYYQIPVEALAALNSLAPDATLKRRQVLLIPDAEYLKYFSESQQNGKQEHGNTAAAAALTAGESAGADVSARTAEISGDASRSEQPGIRTEDTEMVSPVSESYAACNELTYDRWSRTYTVSLVLPFGASRSSVSADAGQMDFYSGALLAFEELKRNRGYDKYRLRVVDLKEWSSVPDMISGSDIEESDLIVGPVSREDLSYVAEYGREKRIPVVSPLDVRTEPMAADNPYLFIFPASASTANTHLYNEFSECPSQEHLVVIYETGTSGKPIVSDVISALDSAGVTYRKFDYGILDGRNVLDHLLGSADTTDVYKVMVASENEAFVADALRNLNVLANQNFKLSVYGFPKWRNFESVETENLHTLNTHICGYYVDYTDVRVSYFVKRYENVFHTSPSPFAFQGYDIMTYFLTSMEEYGAVFPVKINGITSELAQSDVRFVPVSPAGGFRNEAVREMVYRPGWRTEILR